MFGSKLTLTACCHARQTAAPDHDGAGIPYDLPFARGLDPCGSPVQGRDQHLAFAPNDADRDLIAMAMQREIDARSGQAQITDRHFVDEGRQPRIAQPDFAVSRIEFEPERGLHQREGGRGGPCLRRAGDRIERRPTPAVTGGVNPRMDGEACAGEEKGAAEAPGLFNGMAVQSDGLSVVSSV